MTLLCCYSTDQRLEYHCALINLPARINKKICLHKITKLNICWPLCYCLQKVCWGFIVLLLLILRIDLE